MAQVVLAPRAVDNVIDDLATRYHRLRAPRVLFLLQIATPVDTGALRASGRVDPILHRSGRDRVIRFTFDRNGDPAGFSVAQVIFAGRKEVRPVRANALRWVNKAGVVVFAQRSRAVPPNRWPIRVFVAIGYRNVAVARR